MVSLDHGDFRKQLHGSAYQAFAHDGNRQSLFDIDIKSSSVQQTLKRSVTAGTSPDLHRWQGTSGAGGKEKQNKERERNR